MSIHDLCLLEKDFIHYVEKVAQTTLTCGGSTSRIDTYEFMQEPDIWIFPKYPQKTCILSDSTILLNELKNFISKNEHYLLDQDCWLGTWIHPTLNFCYLDIVTKCDKFSNALEESKNICFETGKQIVAIYNPKLKLTHYLSY